MAIRRSFLKSTSLLSATFLISTPDLKNKETPIDLPLCAVKNFMAKGPTGIELHKKESCLKRISIMTPMKIICFLLIIAFTPLLSNAKDHDMYQIKVYHLKNNEQVAAVDDYLKNAYLPALHKIGLRDIGVFKPIANDTATVKYIYVIIPFSSLQQWSKLNEDLNNDEAYTKSAAKFVDAPADNAPYERMESILLDAFPGQEHLVVPPSKEADRVFELRSYESPTLHLAEKKMAMFNTGGEIEIFNRLKFNPVFYAKVISGSRMPNLMYMPVFSNVAERDAQWKVFGSDPKWKEISNDPINENKVSVSHIDSILMHSTSYSDY